MNLLVLFLTFIYLALAQDYSEAEFSITEVANPNPSYISLLSSQAYPCTEVEEERECERNLIYEKDTESIFYLISDGRDLKSGSMDVNEVLRNPASYGGDIQTIALSSVFSGQQRFDSVIARFTKDEKIFIEVKFGNQKYNKEIDIPSFD